ncbi:Domain of unknown function DUF4140 [Phaffia rhodozyma]|uniref:Mucoidy inhibitor A n=1 Tax=Phaffia rhodozyma TaxID=264483 RepID=A0A0F7SQX2_PHARH|nr:Domain of unknown function DUF4140 [Phaffia rhodozyma]
MSNSLISVSAKSVGRVAIPSVTLFAAGNIAQVKRQFEVSLQPGQTSVELVHLPAWLDRESLSVEAFSDHGSFDVSILDISFFRSDDDAQEGFSQSLKDLYELRDHQSAVLDTLNSEEQILRAYGEKTTSGGISPDQLTQFIRDFKSRMIEISSERRKVNAEIETTNKKIAKEERAGDYGRGGQPRDMGVSAKLLVGEKGVKSAEESKVNVRFIVTYMVTGASWSPIYEVRAKDSNEQGLFNIDINYRALIVNSTGEPWVGSTLYLSTSSPLRNARVPTLKPYRLSFPAPPPPPSAPSSAPAMEPRMALMRAVPKVLMSASVQEGVPDEIIDGERATMKGADVEGGRLTTILKVEGTVDVACDGEEHTLSIAQLQLFGSMRHVTVPTVNAAAFLEVKATNQSKYPLLPGATRTFLDGNYVSKGRLGNVNPNEEFKISLGVDPSVTVTCSPEEKFRKTSGGFISNSTEVTSFARTVNITNNRSNYIDLEVLYNYPVSEESKIVVRPIPSNIFSSFPIKDSQGNRTDWQEGAGESGSGQVKTMCSIPGGKKTTVKWQWEVEGSGWVVSK